MDLFTSADDLLSSAEEVARNPFLFDDHLQTPAEKVPRDHSSFDEESLIATHGWGTFEELAHHWAVPQHTVSFKYLIGPLIAGEHTKELKVLLTEDAAYRYPLETHVDEILVIANAFQESKRQCSFS